MTETDGDHERAILLPKANDELRVECGHNNYGSDGEFDSSPTKEVVVNEITELELNSVREDERRSNDEEAPTQEVVVRRTAPAEDDNEEDETSTKCGLLYCGRKLLNLLPAIGEGEVEGTQEFEEALRFGAWQVIQLIIPVTICMAVVLFFQLTIAVNERGPQEQLYYLPLHENNSNAGGVNFLFGLVNALVLVALVLIMTTVFVLLFKYRCYKAICVWLVIASGLLLFMISSTYFIDIMRVRRLVIDWFTFVFLVWNFGVTGLLVIHWKGPLRLQQAYLILTSALVATVLIKYLPEWTTWILLAAISIYDLFAVLCPKGPLRVLVETAKERGETIFPSLIYSSTMMWMVGMADVEDKKSSNQGTFPKSRPQKSAAHAGQSSSGDDTDEDTNRAMVVREFAHQENPNREGDSAEQNENEEEEEERRGFKLGLGDFIFYSVLVGKAAKISGGNWVIISSCFVAILIGLCMTSLILGIVHRALPALPISIFFGLVFYFSSQHLISPYVEVLEIHQVFI